LLLRASNRGTLAALRCHALSSFAVVSRRVAVALVLLCVLLLRGHQEATPAWEAAFVGAVASSSQGQLRRWPARPATDVEQQVVEEDEEDEELVRPAMPKTTEEMSQVASDAIMRAYRDGYTRQTVRMRIDGVAKNTGSNTAEYFLQSTLPMVESMTKKLWYGQELKELKTSAIGLDETSTLLYRASTNPRMDAAVLWMMARDNVVDAKVFNWLQDMGDRLVVLGNTETSSQPFVVGDADELIRFDRKQRDVAAQVIDKFSEKTFYFYKVLVYNWQTIFYRVYPFDWEVWIEDLNYTLVKIGSSKTQPDYVQATKWMEEYEEKTGIKMITMNKIAKNLKDNMDIRYDAD